MEEAEQEAQLKKTDESNPPAGPADSVRRRLTEPALLHNEPLIFDQSVPGRKGYSLPPVPPVDTHSMNTAPFALVTGQKRENPPQLPEVTEGQVVRHFTRLSRWNYGIDTNFYPLGSCTMKYNPRLNEEIASDPDWTTLHPASPGEFTQGALEVIFLVENWLKKLTDMPGITTMPAAGAHGELTGLFLVRDYFHHHKDEKRKIVLIPDSAHGTNPASCSLAGFEAKEIPSSEAGATDLEALKGNLDETVACVMLTNPNTLGCFEEEITKIAALVHDNGSFLYMDGANLNAILGKVSLSKMGVDISHMNLHKTFSTPHGGGGPGSGPVVVGDKLVDFLPGPKVRRNPAGKYELFTPSNSIGRVKGFLGHFGMLLRALAYIETYGHDIGRVADHAVLNANYIRHRLKEVLDLASDSPMYHEAVFNDKQLRRRKMQTLDLAKGLLDYGFHPPTIYFPLIVSGAFMVEPTETEPVADMDDFSAAVREIIGRGPREEGPYPMETFMKKIDEVSAARNPRLNYFQEEE